MTDTMTTDVLPPPAPPAPPSGGRWPRRKLLTVAAIAVVAMLVVVWVVAFSPLFGARNVRVTGVTGAAADEVVSTAGIAHGTALLRLDTASVSSRVRALPWVAAASVRTSFPSTVTIDVTPRVPVGYVKVGSGYRLMDHTGLQYQSVTSVPKSLPLFVLAGGAVARATGAAAATVAAALPASVRAQMALIEARGPESITLVLRDHRVVHWGGVERSAEKAALLPTLLQQRGQSFDVSNPDLVVAH